MPLTPTLSTPFSNKFKTLDQFIEWHAVVSLRKFATDEEMWGYILQHYAGTIMKILNSKTNEPSVHDLTIIKIVKYLNNKVVRVKIIEAYKNR